MADPETGRWLGTITLGEIVRWLGGGGMAALLGALGYRRWGGKAPSETLSEAPKANGRLDAIPRLANSVDAFVLHMTAFTTAVSVQHATQTETLARQTALLGSISESLSILRDRADHPVPGPAGPMGPPGPAGPPGPMASGDHGRA